MAAPRRHIAPAGGAALVELALCLPVLLLFAASALDLAQLASASMAAGDAAAAGVRGGAAAIEAGADPSSAKTEAERCARLAAPTLPASDLEVSVKAGAGDLGPAAERSQEFDRRVPNAEGGVESSPARISGVKVECSASVRVTPKTPVGAAIYAAAGDASGMTLSATRTEWAEELS